MRNFGNFFNFTRRKASFETESTFSPLISEPILQKYNFNDPSGDEPATSYFIPFFYLQLRMFKPRWNVRK